MTHTGPRNHRQNKRILRLEGGRIYFSKDAERKLFFALTVIMLLAGICFKLGVLQ